MNLSFPLVESCSGSQLCTTAQQRRRPATTTSASATTTTTSATVFPFGYSYDDGSFRTAIVEFAPRQHAVVLQKKKGRLRGPRVHAADSPCPYHRLNRPLHPFKTPHVPLHYIIVTSSSSSLMRAGLILQNVLWPFFFLKLDNRRP